MTEKLNIGVIGAGNWAGWAHLPGFTRSPLSEVVAICDLNRELAESRAEEFNIDGVYTDYQEMLRKEAAVIRPMHSQQKPENCQGTTNGVRHVDLEFTHELCNPRIDHAALQ